MSDKIKVTDNVHGQIEFEPYFRELIMCAEFQRLRNIKQLGSAFMVYPQTATSRYEHSIGVSYLANKLIDILETNSKIKVSLFHRKCVSIAGLLHDVGHGPFSHMWEYLMDQYFNEKYHHEDISCRMVERIFRHVTNVFDNDDDQKRGVRLIQSLIQGDLDDLQDQLGDDMYLAEIISNKYSEIDVDRIDYILRDFLYMNHVIDNVQPDFSTFLENTKVFKGSDGVKHIHYLEDDLKQIYYLFKNRIELHKQLYQNSSVVAAQILLCEFLKAADDNNFKFQNTLRLTEMTKSDDLTQFILFDDTIVRQIISQLTSTTTGQYETLERFIVNNKLFRLIDKDEYDKRKGCCENSDKNFRVYKRTIEDPFKKFKIFLDRQILYNRNNNRVVVDVDDVKRMLKLDTNRAIEWDIDEEIFHYFVET